MDIREIANKNIKHMMQGGTCTYGHWKKKVFQGKNGNFYIENEVDAPTMGVRTFTDLFCNLEILEEEKKSNEVVEKSLKESKFKCYGFELPRDFECDIFCKIDKVFVGYVKNITNAVVPCKWNLNGENLTYENLSPFNSYNLVLTKTKSMTAEDAKKWITGGAFLPSDNVEVELKFQAGTFYQFIDKIFDEVGQSSDKVGQSKDKK